MRYLRNNLIFREPISFFSWVFLKGLTWYVPKVFYHFFLRLNFIIILNLIVRGIHYWVGLSLIWIHSLMGKCSPCLDPSRNNNISQNKLNFSYYDNWLLEETNMHSSKCAFAIRKNYSITCAWISPSFIKIHLCEWVRYALFRRDFD